MAFRFIADSPLTESKHDTLGLGGFVQQMYEALLNTEAPFVYGVLGNWGSGKTSTLQLLKAAFERRLLHPEGGQTVFIPVWLDAWKYEKEETMIFPLIYAFKNAHARYCSAAVNNKTIAAAFLDVVTTSAIAFADLGLRVITKKTTGEALSLEDIGKHYGFGSERGRRTGQDPGQMDRKRRWNFYSLLPVHGALCSRCGDGLQG